MQCGTVATRSRSRVCRTTRAYLDTVSAVSGESGSIHCQSASDSQDDDMDAVGPMAYCCLCPINRIRSQIAGEAVPLPS